MQSFQTNFGGSNDHTLERGWFPHANLPLAHGIGLTSADTFRVIEFIGSLVNQFQIPTLSTSDSWQDYIALIEARVTRLQIEASESKRRNAELESLVKELTDELEFQRAMANTAKYNQVEADRKISELEAKLNQANKTIAEMCVKLGDPPPTPGNSGVPSSKGNGQDKKGKNKKEAKPEAESDKNNNSKRKQGGQKGHEPRVRNPFDNDEIDRVVEHAPESTTCECGCEMERHKDGDEVRQQFELPEKTHEKLEHRGASYKCPKCGRTHKGTIPDEAKGLFGPRLVALIVSLKLNGNASFRNIQRILDESFDIQVSLGFISNCFNKASECLEPAYQEVKEAVKKEPVLNVDETTHRENGRRLYTWAFCGAAIILFAIGDRSRTIIDSILTTEWTGIIICDYYGVYLSFAKDAGGVTLQHCVVHLAREFRRCAEHTLDPEIQAYGEKMLALIDELYKARDAFIENSCGETLANLRLICAKFNREAANAPPKGRPATIAKRFSGEDSTYTTFVNHPGTPTSNNAAERAVRRIVMIRHVTQGTRGEKGRKAAERYWTVKATCELQGRSFRDFFLASYYAMLRKEQGPSILPQK
jgi:hypothetical protein